LQWVICVLRANVIPVATTAFTVGGGGSAARKAFQARYRPAKHERVSHNLLIKKTIAYTTQNNPAAILA
jgi:hypothetical protein